MEEGKKNKVSIAVIAVVLIVFIGIFQVYMAFEKRSYKHSDELLADSFSVVEVSMEDEDQTYYVNDTEIIFDHLVQGLETATFKPTKQTPKNPNYIIRMYNDSLQVETTITVFPNQQMQVNDQMYHVENSELKLFEDILFKDKYEVAFNNIVNFATYINKEITERGFFLEENKDWAEIIALTRIAQEKEVDLSYAGLLYLAPTKEVAEQLITYDVIDPYDSISISSAVLQERIEVVQVLLENHLATELDMRIIQEPSLVVMAKLNEDEEMVDLLLNYGFEDEFVDPRHIEQVQKKIDFSHQNSQEIIANLKEGKLPGVDFQIPTSSEEIIEAWGEYPLDVGDYFLSYNYHSFSRMIDSTMERKGIDYDDVFAYDYQFLPDDLQKIVDIRELLGEPDDMYINEGISHFEYIFGNYMLSFMIDSDGYVRHVNYYYEQSE